MINLIPKIVRNEEAASSHINIISHYDDVTLLDKSDKLIQIIRLQGLDCVSHDETSLNTYKMRINNLLKGFSSDFAIYCWEFRKRVTDYPGGEYPNGYANDLNERYGNKIKSTEMFRNELYISVITKQPEGLINRGFSLLQEFNRALDKEYRNQYLSKKNTELSDMTRKVMSVMLDYGCELLSVYEKNGIKFSAPLEFISRLINGDDQAIPLVLKDASFLLARKRLFFNNHAGTIEFRAANGSSRFAAMLAIKGYSPRTKQGMLNELSRLKCEYLITQSYRFYDRQNAKDKVREQQKEMQQTQNESVTQTIQLNDAFDEAASGEVGLGLHHFTMACFAHSLDELNKNLAVIISKFADLDITCVREEVASECAFWSQLPGNFGYALRSAVISTRNMASLASFHNYPQGKLTGNHWGNAVTVLETQAGTPYYFNFHHKDVGNFLVFGAMGSGKTLLISFLMGQSMKFGGKRVIFDKDRGQEIFVRFMCGTYERLKPGKPTGFNPCQLDDTEENRAFLFSLLSRMLTVHNEILSESDSEIIHHAINGLYRLDKQSRQFCHMVSFFGARKTGSLRNRFDQWHSNGQYAWLFDNEMDALNLNSNVLGFDVGSILDDSECKTPALMYLTYRVQQAMSGERGIIFFDEGWRAVMDPYLRALINDLSRTPRKKNIIFGMATQVANDTVDASISKAINESAFTKIFFPNPSADRSVYVDSLGLSEHDYQRVKKMSDDQFYFLLTHGHGANKESVVARPDLSKMKEDIAILSGRESSVALLDKICAETNDDPVVWMPRFQQEVRNLL